jgi:hypothetical protein
MNIFKWFSLGADLSPVVDMILVDTAAAKRNDGRVDHAEATRIIASYAPRIADVIVTYVGKKS